MINFQKITYSQNGFTIIEIMIAMAIFAIGILAIAKMQISATNGNVSARKLTESSSLASDQMERLMILPYNDSELARTEGSPRTPAVQPLPGYNLLWTVLDSTDDSLIPVNTKRVTVTVAQNGIDADRSFSIEQLIAEIE